MGYPSAAAKSSLPFDDEGLEQFGAPRKLYASRRIGSKVAEFRRNQAEHVMRSCRQFVLAPGVHGRVMHSTTRRFVSTAVTLVCIGLVAADAGAADLERGEALFDLCAQCHGDDASGNEAYLAPAIAGLSEWYVAAELRLFQKGGRGTHFDDIAGMRMRPMALTLFNEEDVDAVSAYVASLPKVNLERTLDGDPAKGKAGYAVCAGCHGVDAKGNKAVMAPSLHTSDWYLFRQMQNYKAGVRGTNPVDTFGMAMRPMAMTLPTDDAVKDVIAYIMSLSK